MDSKLAGQLASLASELLEICNLLQATTQVGVDGDRSEALRSPANVIDFYCKLGTNYDHPSRLTGMLIGIPDAVGLALMQ